MPPGLAVILVGSDAASQVYVQNKVRVCANVGIRSFRFDYTPDVNQQVVIDKIEELNEDPNVHGILVQLPLRPAFDIARILHQERRRCWRQQYRRQTDGIDADAV